MADRRMLHKELLLSDVFLDLSKGARALYITLCLSADDDGFTAGIRSLMRQSAATAKELAELVSTGYLISFPSGVHVITHWRMHNTIRKDRYRATRHADELAQLCCTEDGIYRLQDGLPHPEAATKRQPNDNQAATKRQPNGNQAATERQPNDGQSGNPGKVRLGQDRLGQDRLGQVSVCQDAASGGHTHAERQEKRGYGAFGNVMLTEAEYLELAATLPDFYERLERFSRALKKYGYSYKSHRLALEDFDMAGRNNAHSTASDTCGSSFDTDEFFQLALARSYGTPIT